MLDQLMSFEVISTVRIRSTFVRTQSSPQRATWCYVVIVADIVYTIVYCLLGDLFLLLFTNLVWRTKYICMEKKRKYKCMQYYTFCHLAGWDFTLTNIYSDLYLIWSVNLSVKWQYIIHINSIVYRNMHLHRNGSESYNCLFAYTFWNDSNLSRSDLDKTTIMTMTQGSQSWTLAMKSLDDTQRLICTYALEKVKYINKLEYSAYA